MGRNFRCGVIILVCIAFCSEPCHHRCLQSAPVRACEYVDIEGWFRRTVGVRQGCLLSAILFNMFLERIMADALEDHKGTVRIGCRTITNLRFADDIDGLAGEREELAKSAERLDKASTAYGMEISAEKTKLMTNNTSGINTEIKMEKSLRQSQASNTWTQL